MDKVIISDTSCLIALSKIEKLNLLKGLYNEIVITKDVYHLANKGFRLSDNLINNIIEKYGQK